MNTDVPIIILIYFCTSVVVSAPTTQPADALAHKRYRSVELREHGLGQHGVVLGHWSLSFGRMSGNAGVYAWDWSDVRSVGLYHLAPDGTILAGNRIKARYDAANDRVLWNGMWYERVRQSATRPSTAEAP